MKKSVAGVVGGFLILAQLACGRGSSPVGPSISAVTSPAVSLGTVDPALVGTWAGRVDGSGGPDAMTMWLDAGGAMSTAGTRPFYNPLDGRWGVSGSRFTAIGRDSSIEVTFTATVSGTSISGSWSGTNGTAGTFSITKQ